MDIRDKIVYLLGVDERKGNERSPEYRDAVRTFAERVGVKERTVYRWLDGTRTPAGSARKFIEVMYEAATEK